MIRSLSDLEHELGRSSIQFQHTQIRASVLNPEEDQAELEFMKDQEQAEQQMQEKEILQQTYKQIFWIQRNQKYVKIVRPKKPPANYPTKQSYLSKVKTLSIESKLNLYVKEKFDTFDDPWPKRKQTEFHKCFTCHKLIGGSVLNWAAHLIRHNAQISINNSLNKKAREYLSLRPKLQKRMRRTVNPISTKKISIMGSFEQVQMKLQCGLGRQKISRLGNGLYADSSSKEFHDLMRPDSLKKNKCTKCCNLISASPANLQFHLQKHINQGDRVKSVDQLFPKSGIVFVDSKKRDDKDKIPDEVFMATMAAMCQDKVDLNKNVCWMSTLGSLQKVLSDLIPQLQFKPTQRISQRSNESRQCLVCNQTIQGTVFKWKLHSLVCLKRYQKLSTLTDPSNKYKLIGNYWSCSNCQQLFNLPEFHQHSKTCTEIINIKEESKKKDSTKCYLSHGLHFQYKLPRHYVKYKLTTIVCSECALEINFKQGFWRCNYSCDFDQCVKCYDSVNVTKVISQRQTRSKIVQIKEPLILKEDQPKLQTRSCVRTLAIEPKQITRQSLKRKSIVSVLESEIKSSVEEDTNSECSIKPRQNKRRQLNESSFLQPIGDMPEKREKSLRQTRARETLPMRDAGRYSLRNRVVS